MRQLGAVIALVVTSAASLPVAAADQAPVATDAQSTVVAGPPVNAVWVDKDISFTYMGFTTHYSCDGIEDKVKYILKQLGARPGYKVTTTGCANLTGPEIMPRVRIRAALAQEATPDLLKELAKSTPTDELKTKVNGKYAAKKHEATATFPAQWHTVHIEGTPISDVQDGDCELMEQLLRDVMRPLGVKVLPDSRTNCVPHQVSINAVDVMLQVLQPALPEAK